MQIKQFLAFAGAAAISSCAFAAPPAPVALSADGSTVYVAGNASQVVRLTGVEAAEFASSYRLTDGRKLVVSSEREKLFMELGGKREELLPVSATQFVGRSSGAQLTLDQAPYASKVTLSTQR